MSGVEIRPTCKAGKDVLQGVTSLMWNIIFERDKVLFSTKPGPWLLISPDDSDSRHMRWVNEHSDEAFSVARNIE